MSLTHKETTGYYGLRVNPTFDELLGAARKPYRLPMPDRSAKWYALSPYRAFILDAAQKYNEHEKALIDFRNSGAHLPETAAGVQPNHEAAHDEVFQNIERHHEAMEQQSAFEAARDLMHQEHKRETAEIRKQQLSLGYGVNQMNSVIEANHDDLEAAGVEHYMPVVRSVPPRKGWKTPAEQMMAVGQPQAPEFKTFEELNVGGIHDIKAATLSPSQNQTYEQIRNYVVQPTWST